MTEVDQKVERLARIAHSQGLAGVVITLQPNFAWLSGGQSNRIDGSTQAGAGNLLVTSKGQRYLVANTIEMPRLRDEALRGLGFEPVEYPWVADHQDPPAAAAVARVIVGGAPIGADAALPGVAALGEVIAHARTALTNPEMDRYRSLGRDVAAAVEALCRTLQPGTRETAVAQQVNDAVAGVGARAVVTLVGADDRVARFRHPVPTEARWKHTVLIGLCAERHGLVVALSRMVSAVAVSADLEKRTFAAATVFTRLVAATRRNTTGADLYATAASAYGAAGFPGEEALHHQGGAIGYQSRDWIAHPASEQRVGDRQAFAWNPSITGTKVEDTVLVLEDTIDVITSTGEWPAVQVDAGDGAVGAPGILVL